MSRAQRLLDLIQLLRGYRRPVSGAVLAEALGISLRTLYRDIETLNAQGAQIDGEPGIGYVLRPGFMLPPLMFSEEEIEAIVLGSRWVADRTDAALSGAARSALAKISAVLPPDLKDRSRYVGPSDRAGKSDRRRRCRTAGHSLGDPDRAQVADRLSRRQWTQLKAHDLAFRARLFRPRAHRRGVVRAPRGLSAFPHRPHRQGANPRQALSASAAGPVEGMARQRRNSRTLADFTTDSFWQGHPLG